MRSSALNAGTQAIKRFVVERRRDFAEGMSFGDAGPYERLDGVAYLEADPEASVNRGIVGLDRAPRNGDGRVEFSAPFFVLKPVRMERGNRKVLYGISNRGNKQTLQYFNQIEPRMENNDPLGVVDAGDGFLMRAGYTVVDAGWMGNLKPNTSRMRPSLPVARRADGSSIVARVRIEYSDLPGSIPPDGAFTLPLQGRAELDPYEAADLDPFRSSLTVRHAVDGDRVAIPPTRWGFGTSADGSRGGFVPDARHITLFDRFEPNAIYELIYPAKDPLVMGLGYAITRDIASFIRFETHDAAGALNPLAVGEDETGIRRIYAFGGSQSAKYLREFLYLGFNEDTSGRRVFDAVWPHKPGTLRLTANVEFAEPNTYSRQDVAHDYPSLCSAPLSYAVREDRIAGVVDGICKRPATDPLVLQTDSASEFWQFRAALNVTDGQGGDVPIPDNVRLYYLTSLEHDAEPLGREHRSSGENWLGRYPTQPVRHGPTLRALLVALDRWVDEGVAPPGSAYPSIADGTLTTLEDAGSRFPRIPGVTPPAVLNELEVLDFGPDFGPAGGRIANHPPLVGPSYQVLVPAPDADGLDTSGIRPLEVRVPLGTHTGWNLRADGHRPVDLFGLKGSYFAFARTAAERTASGDPRRSLEERYGDQDGFVQAVRAATEALVRERFLLPEDAEACVRDAIDHPVF